MEQLSFTAGNEQGQISELLANVDRELNARLANEKAGSPVIRSFGDAAALEHADSLISLTPKEDPLYYQYIARREVIYEKIRNEEMGEDGDLYVTAKDDAKLFVHKYVDASSNAKQYHNALHLHAVAVSRLKAQVQLINITKARSQREGHVR